ncbi:MAG: alpha/beta fold hydrolase [Acidimicrobiia bacterium]|nr:alpha/beta fold hydrolase [Acidimicrobiia bacterium]
MPHPVEAETARSGLVGTAGRVLRELGQVATWQAIGREVLSAGLAVAAYPLGILEEAMEHAPMRQRGPSPLRNPHFHLSPAAYEVPIVLVHGYAHNRSGYWLLKNRLRHVGFHHVYTLNFNPWLQDVPYVAARLRARVELICSATGHPYVHVVGHSMGGLVARYYVQMLGGDDRVLDVVTIGSPHAGTHAANTFSMLGRTARQLSWQSPLVRILNALPPESPVRFTSIWSSSDELVIPAESARLCPSVFRAENVHLPNEGHLSLLLSQRAIGRIIERLQVVDDHPKLAGHTHAGGATVARATLPSPAIR